MSLLSLIKPKQLKTLMAVDNIYKPQYGVSVIDHTRYYILEDKAYPLIEMNEKGEVTATLSLNYLGSLMFKVLVEELKDNTAQLTMVEVLPIDKKALNLFVGFRR